MLKLQMCNQKATELSEMIGFLVMKATEGVQIELKQNKNLKRHKNPIFPSSPVLCHPDSTQ